MVNGLSLEQKHIEEIVDHARSELPHEACGLLAGMGGQVAKVYRATNVEKSPVRYSIDPRELIRYMKDMDQHEWDLVGIYHSHTHTQAYPSATDVDLAFYPEAVYLILSLKNRIHPVIRGFRIVEGAISEVAVLTNSQYI